MGAKQARRRPGLAGRCGRAYICWEDKRMPGWVAIFAMPLAILAGGTALALRLDDPLWLVFSAVLAILTGYTARKFFGS